MSALVFDSLRAKAQPGYMNFRLVEDAKGQNGELLGKAGEVVTLAVMPADVTNQTEELDTYLGGYVPFEFAADLVSKVVLVDKEAANRRDFSKENAFEEVDVTAGRFGAIKQIDHRSETGSYRVKDYALATYIPWATENDAMALYNVRAAAGETIGWKLALAREVRIFTALTTTSNWATANYTSILAAGKWNTGGSKNPRADIHARIKASAQPVTDIFMNPDVAFYLLGETDFRAYMKQMLGDAAPGVDVAAAAQAGSAGVQTFTVPGLPPFHICPAKKLNLSTGALDYVLGNHVVLVTNQPGVPRDGNRIATHYTYRTKGRSGTGIVTNEYIPQGKGINGGTMFEMGYSEDAFFASNIAGGLIYDVLS